MSAKNTAKNGSKSPAKQVTAAEAVKGSIAAEPNNTPPTGQEGVMSTDSATVVSATVAPVSAGTTTNKPATTAAVTEATPPEGGSITAEQFEMARAAMYSLRGKAFTERGFWRAGRFWPQAGEMVSLQDLDLDQVNALMAETNIKVDFVRLEQGGE